MAEGMPSATFWTQPRSAAYTTDQPLASFDATAPGVERSPIRWQSRDVAETDPATHKVSEYMFGRWE